MSVCLITPETFWEWENFFRTVRGYSEGVNSTGKKLL